jgi:hypothetical protein
MRILLMPLINAVATKAWRQAASAAASSDSGWFGDRLGERINPDPQRGPAGWRCSQTHGPTLPELVGFMSH